MQLHITDIYSKVSFNAIIDTLMQLQILFKVFSTNYMYLKVFLMTPCFSTMK